jgi:hypothetical protein
VPGTVSLCLDTHPALRLHCAGPCLRLAPCSWATSPGIPDRGSEWPATLVTHLAGLLCDFAIANSVGPWINSALVLGSPALGTESSRLAEKCLRMSELGGTQFPSSATESSASDVH